MMDSWLDDPEAAASHMAFGMDLNQRRQARQLKGKDVVSHRVCLLFLLSTLHSDESG